MSELDDRKPWGTYPWDDMLDGQRWEFPIEDLEGVSLVSFRQMAYQAARRRGIKRVSVRTVGRLGDYVRIQAEIPADLEALEAVGE